VNHPADLATLALTDGPHSFLLAQRYVENPGFDIKGCADPAVVSTPHTDAKEANMHLHDPAAWLSLPDLLSTSTSLFERVHEPLLPGAQEPRGLSVRYVRRKPGCGLALTYTVYARPSAPMV
jgi:hypothetical protein